MGGGGDRLRDLHVHVEADALTHFAVVGLWLVRFMWMSA